MTELKTIPKTPIMALFHKHREILKASAQCIIAAQGAKAKAQDREAEARVIEKLNKMEAELMALPATCAADFAAKVIIDTCCGDSYPDWITGALWREARELTGMEVQRPN